MSDNTGFIQVWRGQWDEVQKEIKSLRAKLAAAEAENKEYQRQFDVHGAESLETLIARERGINKRLQARLTDAKASRDKAVDEVRRTRNDLSYLGQTERELIDARAEIERLRRLLLNVIAGNWCVTDLQESLGLLNEKAGGEA